MFVIDVRDKHRVVIEEMYLLLVAHGDVRMLRQKIMKRRCAGFLCASQNEIEPLDLSSVQLKHRTCSHRPAAASSTAHSAVATGSSHVRALCATKHRFPVRSSQACRSTPRVWGAQAASLQLPATGFPRLARIS